VDYIRQRGGEVLCNTRVAQLLVDAEGCPEPATRLTGVRLETSYTLEADAFVISAPLHSVRQLLPAGLRGIPYFDRLWGLKSVPVINVQVWFDRYVCNVDNLFFTAHAPFSVFADL